MKTKPTLLQQFEGNTRLTITSIPSNQGIAGVHCHEHYAPGITADEIASFLISVHMVAIDKIRWLIEELSYDGQHLDLLQQMLHQVDCEEASSGITLRATSHN